MKPVNKPAGFLFLLTSILILNSCSIQPILPIVHEHSEQEFLLIDVRTDEEFDSGHLQGAINIPYQIIDEHIADINSSKNQEIILYCRSGRRSEIAKTTLLELGYTNVTNAGGYEEIRAAGKYD